MKENKITAVCFDMWGTLVEGGGKAQIDDLKRILGGQDIGYKKFLSQTEESLLTHAWILEEGIEDLVKNFGLRVSKEEIKSGYESWWSYVLRAKPFPETEKVLRKLQERNLRLLVVSNTDLPAFRFKIKELGWSKFFEKFFLSAEIGLLKPHPKIFGAVEKYLKLPREKILMVDDSLYHGVLPARQFGWQALWVVRGKQGIDSGKIENLGGIFEFL